MRASPLHQSLRRYGALAVLAIGVALVGLAPSADGDIWWHLAAGREMVARGQLLFTDPFSVSAAGRPWVDVHWLFQLCAYAVHRSLGLAGLVWFKAGLLAVGALVLAAALGRRARADWSLAGFVTLLLVAMFSARSLLLLRPVIMTLLLLAAFMFVLEVVHRRGKTSWLWALPALQVLWANFQGLSALGPAIVAAHAAAAGAITLRRGRPWPFAREAPPSLPAGRHFRGLLVAFAGCTLACAVTPFGLRALLLPFTLALRFVPGADNAYSLAVAENVPPYLLERATGGEFWHLKWFLGVLALATLAAGRRLRLSHALMLLGFTALALLANRNVLLLYWIGAPLAACYLAPAVRRFVRLRRTRLGAPALATVLGAVLTATLASAGLAAARETTLAEPTPFRVPVESARRLAQLPPADVFSADHHGGYLIWSLYPRFRPFVDTRWVLRSADEFREYVDLSEAPGRFDALQAKHQFGYVVLPTAYPDRYLELARHLQRSPEWRVVYTDGSELLYARADLAPSPGLDLADGDVIARINAANDERYARTPELRAAARVNLGRLLATLGELAQAERALAGVEHPHVRALRARLRFAAGDEASAEQLARRALIDDAADVRSLSLLARIALERGETAGGAEWLKRALAADPFDAEAGQILTQLQENER